MLEISAMPLALPLRYSSVQSNAVTTSCYRWTRVLRVPFLPNALLRHVAGGCAEFCSPQYPRRRLGAQTILPVLKSRGVQCLSKSSVARLIYAIFIVNETSFSVTVPSTKQGPCSDSERSGPTPQAISKPPRRLVGQHAREIGRKRRRGTFASAGRC